MTTTKPTWSFLNKWHTYDLENGEASNVVICAECSPIFERDPSLRPLEDQTPDNNKTCASCGKVWQ